MEFKYKVTLNVKGEHLFVGWLYSNSGRREVISFEYVDSYVQNLGFVNIDPLLSKRTGRQFPPSHKNNFGFVEDISPDRWGRNLLKKMIGHAPSNIEAVTLTSDKMRLGSIRIWDLNDTPLSQEPSTPTLKSIKELQLLSRKAEGFSEDIKALYAPGSSLGGARPKAGVLDQGRLMLAKFPKSDDEINVEAWESVMLKLCKHVKGIETIGHFILTNPSLSPYATLVIERFDRDKNGERIPYMSAMTALGYSDGMDEGSYLELAEFIGQNGRIEDAAQLWKRVVFSMLVSNFDDHLRNHGFLLRDGEWRLSPVFDVNPSCEKKYHALSIDGDRYDPDIKNALSLSEYFYLSEKEANSWLGDAVETIRDNIWGLAKKNKISKAEFDEVTKNMIVFSLDNKVTI